jgi:hypothetical protein
VAERTRINRKYATDRLRCDFAHVGLFDVGDRTLWIARRKLGTAPIKLSHARLIAGGTNRAGVAGKDRFVCYWFHTPNTGDGPLHGYPIEWDEGHLMVRMDPNWNYAQQELIRSTDTAQIEKNIDQQYKWGRAIFRIYCELSPRFPLSWHLIGPRPADSMFYVERIEGRA